MRSKGTFILVLVLIIGLIVLLGSGAFKGNIKVSVTTAKPSSRFPSNPNVALKFDKNNLKEIWLAGGCFWGVEAYMSRIYGVYDVTSGYANGNKDNPTYQEVCTGTTGFAETVHVLYDPARVDLKTLLTYFFKVVDPTSKNKQGNDEGLQYRSGVYYMDESDKAIVDGVVATEQKKYTKTIVTEVLPLKNYFLAEEYHQDYLEKNPDGYCHIDFDNLKAPVVNIDVKKYPKPSDEMLKNTLTDIQYKVTQENDTESAYSNEYWDNSEVIYHKDTNYFLDSNLQNKLINESKMAQGYDSKKKILIQPYKIKNTDWTLIGVSSLYELKAIKRQLLETIVFMSLLLLLIAAYIGSYFAGRITSPLGKLEKAMEDIEKGLSQVEVSEQGCYDVQSLALHFNNMVNKIQRLLEEIAQKEKYLRTFELNVLHSQINPHFLYNTLDTIVWMAEFNDTQKVISVTKALAQFFRLSLSGGNELTTIENEIEHVKQYLYIQKQRYEDKLNYELEFNPEISDFKTLKIILQPIVENAIYHGIRETDRAGLIKITAEYDEKDILFTVKDNGVGFDLKLLQLEEVKKNMKLGGVGIKNVDKRIKLFYGEEYGVKIESEIGVGTTVYIKIGTALVK